MQNTAIVDAGPLIALFDASDKHHKKTRQQLQAFRKKHKGKLITSWPVITEACHLLHKHVHLEGEMDFIRWVMQGGLEIYDVNFEHLQKILNLQYKYRDIPTDLADATLVIIAQETGIKKIFSVDKDFGI